MSFVLKKFNQALGVDEYITPPTSSLVSSRSRPMESDVSSSSSGSRPEASGGSYNRQSMSSLPVIYHQTSYESLPYHSSEEAIANHRNRYRMNKNSSNKSWGYQNDYEEDPNAEYRAESRRRAEERRKKAEKDDEKDQARMKAREEALRSVRKENTDNLRILDERMDDDENDRKKMLETANESQLSLDDQFEANKQFLKLDMMNTNTFLEQERKQIEMEIEKKRQETIIESQKYEVEFEKIRDRNNEVDDRLEEMNNTQKLLQEEIKIRNEKLKGELLKKLKSTESEDFRKSQLYASEIKKRYYDDMTRSDRIEVITHVEYEVNRTISELKDLVRFIEVPFENVVETMITLQSAEKFGDEVEVKSVGLKHQLHEVSSRLRRNRFRLKEALEMFHSTRIQHGWKFLIDIEHSVEKVIYYCESMEEYITKMQYIKNYTKDLEKCLDHLNYLYNHLVKAHSKIPKFEELKRKYEKTSESYEQGEGPLIEEPNDVDDNDFSNLNNFRRDWKNNENK